MNKSLQQQRGEARTKLPERSQVEMQFLSLDQWLGQDHRVRIVWQYVESLDLTELYQSIKATRDNVGRDAIDPRILFALLLFATIEGLDSARRIDELTRRDIPYMWICGGVSVNYHRLSDFRTEHGELLERIVTGSIAVLIHQGLIDLKTVAQDGMRVRASAGSGSFRQDASLEAALKEAEAHVENVRQQHAEETDSGDKRRVAARERAAREKKERIEAAREELKNIQNRYDHRSSGKPCSKPRASKTDPEARRMKMADGGTRPALNVQFASDGDAQMIVSVDVSNQGSDSGLMKPMYDDVCARYDVTPEAYLVDGGFGKKDDVTHVEKNRTQVYSPLYSEKKLLDEGKDPYAARPQESAEMTAYRARMGTAEAKTIYKRRGAIAEFPNAECRNRGLRQFRVRGLVKAKAQALWQVLAFNWMRMRNLVCPLRKQSYLEIVMGK
jgi:transposase